MKIYRKACNKGSWNKWQNVAREELIKEEIEKLSPPGVSENKEDSINTTPEHDELEDRFSVELYMALNMIKKDSDPGRDGIDYMMIKNASAEVLQKLLDLFNEIWCGVDFP